MATAIDINDREGLRSVLREINFDDYKTSSGMSTLIEEDRKKGTAYREGMVTEDELIEVLRYLRAPSGRGGRSNLEYLSEYKKEEKTPTQFNAPYCNNNYKFPLGVQTALMEDKKREEEEYYGKRTRSTSYDAFEIKEQRKIAEDIKERNRFMNPQENTQKPKQSLEEIKARYMEEMNALTKRFQDEINNLG